MTVSTVPQVKRFCQILSTKIPARSEMTIFMKKPHSIREKPEDT